MRVIARNVDIAKCPPKIEPYLRQVRITPGKQYEVYGVAVVQGVIYVAIVDDTGLHMSKPIWLFELVDKTLPNDWICNFFPEQFALVLGPELLAKSAEAYDQLVERDPEVSVPFWERVRAHRKKIVRQILLNDWDPFGIKDEPEGQDIYDPYIPELLVLLEQQPSDQQLFDYLWRVVNDQLELIGNREKTRIAATKILTLI